MEAGTNDAAIMKNAERTPNPGQAVVNTYENSGRTLSVRFWGRKGNGIIFLLEELTDILTASMY